MLNLGQRFPRLLLVEHLDKMTINRQNPELSVRAAARQLARKLGRGTGNYWFTCSISEMELAACNKTKSHFFTSSETSSAEQWNGMRKHVRVVI